MSARSRTNTIGHRRGRKRVTISDVAREAGVSTTTVSRVMNGTGPVSAARRAAVGNAISRLQYIPDFAARSLTLAHGERLALLHGGPGATWLSRLLVGALEESGRIGVQVIVQKVQFAVTDGWLVARQLLQGGVAGAILPPPLGESTGVIQALHALNLPAVAIAPGKPHTNAMCVRTDDYAAAQEMTHHLLALGHRRIGFIRGHPAQGTSEQRWRGFLAALSDTGVDTDQVCMEQGFGSYRSGLEAARKLLSNRPAPTAIFASDDDMAAAVVHEAQRRGLDVPRVLSVVGFGDSLIAHTVWPELTTIHQPVMEMAAQAVNMLLQAIQAGRTAGPPSVQHKVLAHTLVVRASAAAVPAED